MKNIVYFKKDKILFYNGKKVEIYTYDNFYKNLPKGKVYIIFSSETIHQKIVEVSKKTKISKKELNQLMLGEVVDTTNIQIQLVPKKFIYNWKTISEDDDNIYYLLYIVPNEEIERIISYWDGKEYKIKDIFWDVDVLINSSLDFIEDDEENLIFFENNSFYYLAFKNRKFLFQRKIELSEQAEDDLKYQQLILELKRSYFYTKQQYKFTTSNFILINPPKWIKNYVDSINEELVADKLKFFDNFFVIYNDLILSLFIKNKSIKNYISVVPAKVRKEKTYLVLSQVASIILLIFLILFIFKIYQKFLEYNKSLNNYINKTIAYTYTLKEASKYINEIKNIENLEIQKKEYEKILSKKAYSPYYLIIFPFEIPNNIFLKEVNVDFNNNLIYISGKVDSKNLNLKNIVFQRFISNLIKCPVSDEFKNINLKSFIRTGDFEIILKIKKIVLK